MDLADFGIDAINRAVTKNEFENMTNLLNDDSVTETQAVIYGLLRKSTKVSFSGSSKTNKTWIILDLATSVSTGTKFLRFATEKTRVLYVNFELQRFSLRRRVAEICKRRGVDNSQMDSMDILTLRGKPVNLDDFIARLIARNREVGGYGLIIVDPCYKLLTGQNENDTAAISNFCAGMDRLAETTKAAVIYIGHYSKGNQAAKSSIDRQSGSGIFSRDADSIITVTAHKVPECFTMEFVVRDFPQVPSFVVEFEYPVMKERPELDPEDLRPSKEARSSGVVSFESILQFIPDGDENPISQKDLFLECDDLGISERTARDAIKGLLEENRIYKWETKRPRVRAEVGYHKQPPLAQAGKDANL